MWHLGDCEPAVVDGHIWSTAMPQFDPELITVMKKVLEDTMMRVPSEYSNPAAKAYFAEYILKAAAQGKTSYDADRCGSRSDRGVCIFVQLGPRLDTTSLIWQMPALRRTC